MYLGGAPAVRVGMTTPLGRPSTRVPTTRKSPGVLTALLVGGSLAATGAVPALGAEGDAEEESAEHEIVRAETTSQRHTSLCDAGTCYLAWFVADSDGDGVADADEIVVGTDPDDPRRVPVPRELVERIDARELPSFEAGLGTLVGLPAHMVEDRSSGEFPWADAFPVADREGLLDELGVDREGLRGPGSDPAEGFALGLGTPKDGDGVPPVNGSLLGLGEASYGSGAGVTVEERREPTTQDADGNRVSGTWYVVKDGDGRTTSETYTETVTYPDGSTRTETTVFTHGEDPLGRPTVEESEPTVTTTEPATGTTGGSAPADDGADDGTDGTDGTDDTEGTDNGTTPEEDVNGDGVVDEEDEEAYESPDGYGFGGAVVVGPQEIARALGKLDWNRTPSDPWDETTYTGGGDPQVPDDGSLIYPLPDGAADSVLVIFGAGSGVTPSWNDPQPRTIDDGLDPQLPFGGDGSGPTGGGGCLECR